jgi:hypothetical protein
MQGFVLELHRVVAVGHAAAQFRGGLGQRFQRTERLQAGGGVFENLGSEIRVGIRCEQAAIDFGLEQSIEDLAGLPQRSRRVGVFGLGQEERRDLIRDRSGCARPVFIRKHHDRRALVGPDRVRADESRDRAPM